MFRPLFAPLLATLTLTATATALAAEPHRLAAGVAPAGAPAVHQRAGSAAPSDASRPEIALLLVLAFASVGGGVGLIAAGRGAPELDPSA
jgi:hypothetical protein